MKEYGLIKWKKGNGKINTIKKYSEKEVQKKEIVYNGDMGTNLLFKAGTNFLEINDRTYRFDKSRDKLCKMCNREVDETLDHLTVECLQ